MAELSPLMVLGLVDHGLSQVGQVVADLAPAGMGVGEDVLDQVLTQVPGATHEIREPEQREPVLAIDLLVAGRRHRLRITHNQYVVCLVTNVAAGRTLTVSPMDAEQLHP